MLNKEIKFNEWNCTLNYSTYSNKRTAIELIDAEDGMPIAMATVNIPDASIESDEVIIKNWSENEGIREALQVAGIIGPTLRKIPTGFVLATVHKLLKDVDDNSSI